MKSSIVAQLHSNFEALVQIEEDTSIEFWMARDLQEILGYARWENFAKVIEKARTACMTSGYDESDHFLDVTKMIGIGKGGQREIEDITLTRTPRFLKHRGTEATEKALEKQLCVLRIASL